MAIKPQTFTADDALESGVIGTVYDPIENDAYTVSGQGEDTATREREARRELRSHFEDASVETSKTSRKSKPKPSTSSSS
jgi:fructose-1,6-bisphosphatase/inositol monophosphatase family enzyme